MGVGLRDILIGIKALFIGRFRETLPIVDVRTYRTQGAMDQLKARSNIMAEGFVLFFNDRVKVPTRNFVIGSHCPHE